MLAELQSSSRGPIWKAYLLSCFVTGERHLATGQNEMGKHREYAIGIRLSDNARDGSKGQWD